MTIEKKNMSDIGRRIERIRELKGIKQETLASSLGVSQQTISRIERSDTVDEEKLEKIAEALGVSTEAIKNFDENAAIVNIQNNHEGANSGSGTIGNNLNYYHCH